jgi:hypothetical protein
LTWAQSLSFKIHMEIYNDFTRKENSYHSARFERFPAGPAGGAWRLTARAFYLSIPGAAKGKRHTPKLF